MCLLAGCTAMTSLPAQTPDDDWFTSEHSVYIGQGSYSQQGATLFYIKDGFIAIYYQGINVQSVFTTEFYKMNRHGYWYKLYNDQGTYDILIYNPNRKWVTLSKVDKKGSRQPAYKYFYMFKPKKK